MNRLAEREIIENIKQGRCFSAVIDSGAFEIIIEEYVPVVATAIHDGHRVSEPFAAKMKVSEDERRFEEDPYTGLIAETFSLSIKVLDSRYYYDLNRPPEVCVYDEAWGKQVWQKTLSEVEQQQLRGLHAVYYRVFHTLLHQLENRFGRCVVYDLHSYNYSRINGSPPLFNVGTHFVDRDVYTPVLDNLMVELQQVVLPGSETRAVCDDVFSGKGYLAEFMHHNHPGSLCIPLEIKKVFMEEQSFGLKEEVFGALRSGMKKALSNNSTLFTKLSS